MHNLIISLCNILLQIWSKLSFWYMNLLYLQWSINFCAPIVEDWKLLTAQFLKLFLNSFYFLSFAFVFSDECLPISFVCSHVLVVDISLLKILAWHHWCCYQQPTEVIWVRMLKYLKYYFFSSGCEMSIFEVLRMIWSIPIVSMDSYYWGGTLCISVLCEKQNGLLIF